MWISFPIIGDPVVTANIIATEINAVSPTAFYYGTTILENEINVALLEYYEEEMESNFKG